MHINYLNTRHSAEHNSKQGSALLTAVIFSFLVMALMGSYLLLSSSEYRLSTRSFLANASLNLAEGGIELAIDAIQSGSSSGWDTGTDVKSRAYWAREFDDYDLGGNIEGVIKVVILNPSSQNPEIYSEGVAEGHVAGEMDKQLYANMTSGFLPFQNGFNTKNGILLKGTNVVFDSYDSRNGPYGLGNINSNVTISTTSVTVDSIDIGNADVYGYVATGASMPDVGPKGSITDYANPGKVDASRITTDYYADFPNVPAETLSSPLYSLPTNGVVLGGEYLISTWSSSGGDTLFIQGDTTIVVTGDMSMSGKASIVIDPGVTVKIYSAGNISLAGNGVANGSQKPEQFMIFGTDTTEGAKDLSISGNGVLAASVYAPNSNVTLNGGGSSGRVYGAIAAFDAKLNGNSHFSYDEALADYNLGSGGYVIDEWVEIAGVGRASMELDMSAYGL